VVARMREERVRNESFILYKAWIVSGGCILQLLEISTKTIVEGDETV
jgi:hypothetical protein